MREEIWDNLTDDIIIALFPMLMSYIITLYISMNYKIENIHLALLFGVLTVIIMLINFYITDKLLWNK